MTGSAVVVGATGTLGRAAVRRLSARGLRVVAVARSADALAQLADEDPSVVPVAADLSANAGTDLVRGALDGPVRMALFCAGLPVRGSVASIDPDLLAVGAQVKMAGVVRLWHAVRDRFEAGSRFVAVAGTLGLEPGRDEAGPGAINAGLVNLMKQVSHHHGPDGVTVHTLAPGPMDTPRLRALARTIADERRVPEPAVWAEYEAKVSLGRLPTVEEVAWAVDRLLDPEAAIMHGTVWHLDAGGLRAPG